MTDEDQPSKKDEQVYWAPQTGALQPGAGRDADQDADATAERPAVGQAGSGAPGQGIQYAGQDAQASAERSPQNQYGSAEQARYGGSSTPQQPSDTQGQGQRVTAPAWPAYPPRPADQGQYGQGGASQSGQGQYGQGQYGQSSAGQQNQYGQTQQYPAYPSSASQNQNQNQPQQPNPGQSGWSSPSGPPTGPWSADLGDTRNQPNPQNPASGPGSQGNPDGQGSNPDPLVPGLSPWGAPPPMPPGRATGRASGRASLIAAALGVGLLAGVLGGFGGSALYDDVSDSNGRSATVTLPEPVRDNREQTAGEVTSVAAAVTPSVVSLEVVAGQSQGTGSGFVIDAENGYILTNNHVVAGDGSDDKAAIQVVFQDGTQAKGTLVGADASYDLAVVKVNAKGLRELTFGDSDDVQVGDPVVAIGAPLGLSGTVTTGIVSALNRPVAAGEGDTPAFINAIQTDAAINPGNSGGPLVNAAGRVIAVNSAIARVPGTTAETTGGSIGLGFAIPSNQAQRTAQQLIKTGKADHPIIGVTLDSTYTGEGVLVSQQATNGQEPVTPGGPADSAGVEPGDVITKFNGRPVTAPDELIVAIRAEKPGDTVTLTIRRGGGNEQDVKVKLDASSD